MSEITIKTIESLPLIEEPAEGASIVGWSEGRTVRMPIDAVGGSKGIVFTIESNENAINPVDSDTSEWNVSCNYDFDTFLELYKNGAPMVLVNTSWCTVTHQVCGNWYEGQQLLLGQKPAYILAAEQTELLKFIILPKNYGEIISPSHNMEVIKYGR